MYMKQPRVDSREWTHIHVHDCLDLGDAVGPEYNHLTLALHSKLVGRKHDDTCIIHT